MHTFAQNLGVRVIHVDASGEFLAALAGVADPEQKRQIIGALVRRRVPARSGEARQREVAGAGHDLSGRDRVGRRQDQEGAHDQVAPQRRRPARDAAPEAARAAARALQGRSARARRSSSACRARWCIAIRSRDRASACASWARSRASAPSSCAAPTRSSSTSCATARRRRRQVVVRQDRAGVRGVPARAIGGRDGRRPHLRARRSRCAPCRRRTS